MIKIFLSHVGEDSVFVDEFMNFVENNNQIRCWNYRRDFNALSSNISESVSNAIAESDYMVVFWSKNVLINSIWIQREFEQGIQRETELRAQGNNRAFIILINIDDSELPTWLSGRRHLNLNDIEKLKTAIIDAGQRHSNGQSVWWDRPAISIATSKDQLLIITNDKKLIDAKFLMDTADVRHLIVVNQKNKAVGIVSKRNILRFVPPKLKFTDQIISFQYQKIIGEASNIPMSRLMTQKTKLVYLSPHSTIKDAADNFIISHQNGRVSSLPILDDNDFPIGILSYMDVMCNKDIIRPKSLVQDYCTLDSDNMFKLHQNDTLAQAKELMEAVEKRHMPVVDDDGYLVGMIDDITVLWLSHPKIDLGNQPVSRYMQPINSIITIALETLISDVIDEFLCTNKELTALPVVKKEGQRYRLMGIFSYVDALKAIYEYPPNPNKKV